MWNIFRSANRSRCAPVLSCLLAVFAAVLSSSNSVANEKLEELAQRVGVRILAEATSDSDMMTNCKSQIPYGKMSPRSQQRASHIISNLSQYRRMPSLQYEVNPGLYQYLINHPDVAISTWRVMGISKLQMFQTAQFEYEASAADGSVGIADILWRDGNQCLFIVQGTYTSPLLPGAIDASALVWLRYRFVNSTGGKVMVNQQVETFISFPSHAVDTLARMASMVTNTILDRNVIEVSLYARMMSTAAAKEPEWIAQVGERMHGVLPQRSMELVRVSRGQNPDVGSLLPPVNPTAPPKTASLTRSGAFQAFEGSMQQVNTHVPLVRGEVEHKPSYGKTIGESNPYMARPHAYLPPEGEQALAAQRKRDLRSRQYNEYYSNPEAIGVPSVGIPPVTDGTPDDTVTELPGLSYYGDKTASSSHQKAVTGGIPVSPSAPLRKLSAGEQTKQNLNAQSVSKTKTLPTTAATAPLAPDKPLVLAPVPPVAD